METQVGRAINSKNKLARSIRKNLMLYAFLMPTIVLVIVFNYAPLPGLLVAFMDYDVFDGMSSPLVGLKNFIEIWQSDDLRGAITNTLAISVLKIVIGTPIPILFALMINEIRGAFFKRFTQTVSYMPHFLSWIAVVGIANTIYCEYGIVNEVKRWIFGPDTERVLYLTLQNLFVPNVLIISIWKTFGWSSVIYLATIAGIDANLYEAARIDGASRFKQCIYITIPSIMQTAVMLFILSVGSLFASNFDLIYGLQNVYINYEVISTVIYKQGITAGDYGLSTAFGLAQSVISLGLVLLTNWLSKKVSDISVL